MGDALSSPIFFYFMCEKMIVMKKKYIFITLLSVIVLFYVSAFAEPVNSSSDIVLDSESKESATVTENDEKTINAQEKALTDTDSENVDSDDSQSAEGLSANKVSAVQTATWAEVKRQFKDF